MKSDWKVGDMVYLVGTQRYHTDRTETITKIGRKWITIGEYRRNLRFDPETMWVDGAGYSSPYKVYKSKEDYLNKKADAEYFERLQGCIRWSKAPDISVTLRIAEMLGIEQHKITGAKP